MTRWLRGIALLALLVLLGSGVTHEVAADETLRNSSGPSVQDIDPPGTCDGLLATIIGSGVIRGTGGNDVIVGSENADTIDGTGGDDVICGGGGNDTIHGGSGNDRLFGQTGDDALFGDAGNDELNLGSFVTPSVSVQVAHGGTGNDAFSTDGSYWILCDGAGARANCRSGTEFYGDAGNDRMVANSSGDYPVATFHGGSGNDVATGSGLLFGDAGDDTINAVFAVFGRLNGGSGNDTITVNEDIARLFWIDGGSGRDTCSDAFVVRNCEQ